MSGLDIILNGYKNLLLYPFAPKSYRDLMKFYKDNKMFEESDAFSNLINELNNSNSNKE